MSIQWKKILKKRDVKNAHRIVRIKRKLGFFIVFFILSI